MKLSASIFLLSIVGGSQLVPSAARGEDEERTRRHTRQLRGGIEDAGLEEDLEPESALTKAYVSALTHLEETPVENEPASAKKTRGLKRGKKRTNRTFVYPNARRPPARPETVTHKAPEATPPKLDPVEETSTDGTNLGTEDVPLGFAKPQQPDNVDPPKVDTPANPRVVPLWEGYTDLAFEQKMMTALRNRSQVGGAGGGDSTNRAGGDNAPWKPMERLPLAPGQKRPTTVRFTNVDQECLCDFNEECETGSCCAPLAIFSHSVGQEVTYHQDTACFEC